MSTRLDEIEERAAAARARAHQGWPTSSDVHDQVDTVDVLVAALRAVLTECGALVVSADARWIEGYRDAQYDIGLAIAAHLDGAK